MEHDVVFRLEGLTEAGWVLIREYYTLHGATTGLYGFKKANDSPLYYSVDFPKLGIGYYDVRLVSLTRSVIGEIGENEE